MDPANVQFIVLILIMLLLIYATSCTCKKVDTLISLREGLAVKSGPREVKPDELQARLLAGM